MTFEEFLAMLDNEQNRWLGKLIADKIVSGGWAPEIVVRIKQPDLELKIEMENWCEENCSEFWAIAVDIYWMFVSEAEALKFKLVWG